MKTYSYRRIVRALAVLLLALWSLSYAAAGVYDDVLVWFHFDYDANSDNLAQLDEVRDQRSWGTTGAKGTAGKHATSVHGAPAWSAGPATQPAGGRDYGSRAMVFAPQTNTTHCLPDTFRITSFSPAGNITLVTRFRWDGDGFNASSPGWIWNGALDYGNYRGWMIGVRRNGGTPRLSMLSGRTSIQSSAVITQGKWYDAAVVATDNGTADTVEFYLWAEDGDLIYESHSTTSVTNTAHPTAPTIIGAEASVDVLSQGNALKCFRGALDHIALWNRTLSFAEVNHAFGYPQPVFQIGLDNDRTEDLRIESECDADFNLGDPWHTMRRALTAGWTPANIHFDLSADAAALDYVFHLEVSNTGGGQQGVLRVSVNGMALGDQTVQPNTDYYWAVPHNVLATGANTLTIAYVNGPAAFMAFDWMELAGSWQIGLDNLSQSEFRQETGSPDIQDSFFVTNEEWDDLERALTVGDPDVYLHFELSPEMVNNYRYVYTTRVISQGGGVGKAFSVLVNGTILQSYPPQPNDTLITTGIGKATLVPGANTISLHYDDTASWMQFDFHRLLVAPVPPPGTLFIVR